MLKKTFYAIIGLTMGLLTACRYGELPNADELMHDYTKLENFKTIRITNDNQLSHVSIFYDYPFSEEEGAIEATAYVSGSGEFTATLDVPSHVEELYVLTDGVLTTHPVSDLVLGNTTRAVSMPKDELDRVAAYAHSVYLPTAKYNVTGADLHKCSDLALVRDADHYNTEIESFEFNLINLMRMIDKTEKKNFRGTMYMYVYPASKQSNLTPEDCTFFGTTDSESCTTYRTHMASKSLQLTEIPFSALRDMGQRVQRKEGQYASGPSADVVYNAHKFWPLFYSWENTNYDELHFMLGAEYEGYNVGFVYLGGQNLRFTTPALNIGFYGSADMGRYSQGNGNYIGYELTYNGERGRYTLERNVANGFIWHFTLDGKEYNVLGMDNQYPINDKAWYDADYADFRMLITSTPNYIKPVEEISVPSTEPYTVKQGYYLFEDTYPYTGDYDYNDAIIQYEWRYYTTTNRNVINCSLVAKGCSYNNEFGFMVGDKHYAVIKGIRGYQNVEGGMIDLSQSVNSSIEIKARQEAVQPYLYNGRGYVSKEVAGMDLLPFMLNVPLADGKRIPLRWMIERNHIMDGYQDITADGWYLKVKDETKVMGWGY